LEDGKADLPSSIRAYLVRSINGLVPPHPEDRSEVIKDMPRDLAIKTMVGMASARWSLSRLNSSKRKRSAAWFVGVIMTRSGYKLGEQQVRRICRECDKGLAQRIAKFLLS
jgi:hypothetical protein